MARTVLITGGTGVLGKAVTRRFVEDGHRVAVTRRVAEEIEGLSDLTGNVTFVEADVTNEVSVRSAVEDISGRLGPIEILAHLVGGWTGGEPVQQHSLDTWDRMLVLNLRSAFLCCRAVLPAMQRSGWGRIILVSARAARSGRTGQAGYSVAKAGVAVLAETIAEENRGSDVTANVVAPSVIDTPTNRDAMPGADPGIWVPPADLAASVAFLASEEAGQLRGAWLPVFG
ncbi:MAG: SDR family oxidoreductase, partial [Actinobacteria bacterium]|nr:SDR family oxidoreductase [Actinomycetota bacterium]